MAASTTHSVSRTSGIVGLIGALALIMGSFMAWAKLSFDGLPALTVKGIDRDGKYSLACGVAVLVAAILVLVGKVAKRIPGILMLVFGALGAGVGILNVLTKDSQINDALDQVSGDLTALGITSEEFKELFDVSWEIGIYIVIVGGLVALVAGILALKERSVEAGALMPMGGAGAGTAPPAAPAGTGFDAPPAPVSPAAPPPAAPDPVPTQPPSAPVAPTAPAAPETPPAPPPANTERDTPEDSGAPSS